MPYDLKYLQRCWEAAREQTPLVIVGGGRWARVWADVAAMARGSAKNIALVSRGHVNEVRDWLRDKPHMKDISVVTSLDDAGRVMTAPIMAIIASRPRDHVRDAFEVLEKGGRVLVEKPISDDTAAARQLLEVAMARDTFVGVATEFTFLSALHFVANKLYDMGDIPRRIDVCWADPGGEERYGDVKRTHAEVGILADLMPHFVSLISTVLPNVVLKVVTATETPTAGKLTLVDTLGRQFNLQSDKAANERVRSIEIVCDKTHITLLFSPKVPRVIWNGEELQIPECWLSMDSTLKLELGAYNLSVKQDASLSPLVGTIDLMLRLQDELQNILTR